MDEIIVFDKSLKQRFNEYVDIFGQEKLAVSKIKELWAFYLELSLDPNGWQAIWKIPRLTCEVLKITYPTIVLVYVQYVNFQDLSATVKILAVQDDISLPAKHIVPLINLWPTKEQDNSIGLNIESSANMIDMLRFFYNNLFMPWDYDDDDSLDWIRLHLESRLRLFYDMKNGVIPRFTSEHIQSLISEAKRMQNLKEQIESEVESDSEDEVDPLDARNTKLQKLMQLHVRIVQIRAEIDILENPLMRSVILKQEEELVVAKENDQHKFWLIFELGKVDDFLGFMNQVKIHHPNEVMSVAMNLKNVEANDVVILSKATHELATIGGLEQGGILRGVYSDKTQTIICSKKEDIMLDFSGEVELQNLTINAGISSCGILVRHGRVVLKNCCLIGDGITSTHQGIIVLDGNQLELYDCEIRGFSSAIVGNSGSAIVMKNCKISNALYGIQLFENSQISVEDSKISDCDEHAIFVHVGNMESKSGSFDLLQTVPDVTCHNLYGENNKKGDVKINHKYEIKPLKDLFVNNEVEEEMGFGFVNENLHDTIVENVNFLDA